MNKKIVITGGTGRFGQILKKIKSKYNLFFPNKKQLDVTNFKKIKSYLKNKRPKAVIHLAGLSRPMTEHEKNISKSINLNIIGTANLVRACSDLRIKIIYFSTSYVYPGKKGNYNEIDPVLPWNNYGWSKLGGECAVQMYDNSLVLRACMTEKPFVHKKAFSDVKLNFIYHEDMAKILFNIINKKGVLNIGGKTKTIYKFAKKDNPKIKKIRSNGQYPPRPYMNLSKLRKLLRK
tara:strand:+ start:247 stop:948 length:702 start_codon:yes stop_codon:yes gene_type:complete